jgi:HK97 family phage portal protein
MSMFSNATQVAARMIGIELRGVDSPVSFSDVYGKGLDLFGHGSNSKTGLVVTTDTALEVSTVYGCVRVLADTVSTLPLDQMVRWEGIPRPARPRAEWLEFRQGPWNQIQLFGMIMTSMLTSGNAYVVTVRDGNGIIQWLDILDPANVEPKRLADGSIVYEVTLANAQTKVVGPMDLKHIQGMMLPGRLKGLSPIQYGRETIGLARAATEFGGAFFGNGAIPGSTIEVPGLLSPTAAKVIKDTWEQAHRGVGNSGRIAVLTEGAKYAKVTMSPDEAQFLQTRQFQVPDIARFYGVPLQLLNAEGPQFGTTTAEQNVAFVQHSLRPWIERLEAALTDLLRSEEPIRVKNSFVRLNVNNLLRGNMSERYTVWAVAVTQGILTINEVRKEEGLPPVAWGDAPISVQVQEEPEPAPEADPNPASLPAPTEEPEPPKEETS